MKIQTETTNRKANFSHVNTTINLKSYSSHDLDLRLKKLVTTERKIIHHILECINEIDIRKLYLDQSYPSLYEYLTRGVGYPPASAMRRIDAARFMRQVPEIAQKIETGEINLSQVSTLQKTIREVEKSTQTKVSVEAKKEILYKISNANTQQTEVIIAKELNLEVPQVTVKTQNHQDESQSLTFHFTKEEMVALNQARDLISNSTHSTSLKEALLYLAKKEIQKRSNYKMRGSSKETNQNANFCSNEISNSTTILTSTSTSTSNPTFTSEAEVSPDQYRKTFLKPGAACEYINPKTKQRCGCTQFLNVDHIQPKWAGGKNNLDNLRVLCSAHNKHRYQVQAGFLKF